MRAAVVASRNRFLSLACCTIYDGFIPSAADSGIAATLYLAPNLSSGLPLSSLSEASLMSMRT